MKKALLILSTLFAFAFAANAQSHFGIEAGYDHNWLVYKTKTTGHGNTAKDKRATDYNGFHAGITYRYDIEKVKGLFVGTGLMYQFACRTESENESEEGYEYKEKTSYEQHSLQIPMRVGYHYAFNSDWGVFAYAGPVLNFNVDWCTREKSEETIEGVNDKTSYTKHFVSGKWRLEHNGEKTSGQDDKYKEFNAVDLGLGVAIGANWKNLYLSLGCDFGLTNLIHNKDLRKHEHEGYKTTNTANNHQLKLSIGYTF